MDQSHPTVPALVARSARDFGGHTYLVTPTDRLTYDETERRSAVLACWLLHNGVGKGVRVGLFFPNGVEWVIWWLAVSRIGALAVPLSTLYRPAEIAKVVRLADIALLVAPTRVVNIDVVERMEVALPGLSGQQADQIALRDAPYLRGVVFTGESDRSWATECTAGTGGVPRDVLGAVEAEVTPADLALMVHTSGSTADPKGVLHTHGTLVRQTATWPAAIRTVTGSVSAPVILCAMPFFWIGGGTRRDGGLARTRHPARHAQAGR